MEVHVVNGKMFLQWLWENGLRAFLECCCMLQRLYEPHLTRLCGYQSLRTDLLSVLQVVKLAQTGLLSLMTFVFRM